MLFYEVTCMWTYFSNFHSLFMLCGIQTIHLIRFIYFSENFFLHYLFRKNNSGHIVLNVTCLHQWVYSLELIISHWKICKQSHARLVYLLVIHFSFILASKINFNLYFICATKETKIVLLHLFILFLYPV